MADSPLIEDFFAGVDELRAHLDRHIHTPQRRRMRLAAIARDLLKPRNARALVSWLSTEVHEAVGAQAAGMWLRGYDGHDPSADWLLWHATGAALPARVEKPAGEGPAEVSDGWVLPILGMRRAVALLWLGGAPALDEESRMLLTALGGAAGMRLEQSLDVAALGRDASTGLLKEPAFSEQGEGEVRKPPAAGCVHLVMLLRLSGTEVPSSMVTRVRPSLPPGTPVCVRTSSIDREQAMDVLAVVGDVSAALAQEKIEHLGEVLSEGTSLRWRMAYLRSEHTVDDLQSTVDELAGMIRHVPRGTSAPLERGSP